MQFQVAEIQLKKSFYEEKPETSNAAIDISMHAMIDSILFLFVASNAAAASCQKDD